MWAGPEQGKYLFMTVTYHILHMFSSKENMDYAPGIYSANAYEVLPKFLEVCLALRSMNLPWERRIRHEWDIHMNNTVSAHLA